MGASSQDELQHRLEQAERALEQSQRLAAASRYAAAIMHEVNNPLEAMINLVYLTKLQRLDSNQVYENMLILEQQLAVLGRVTSQALAFHREQTEAKEFDLVGIAESALKLHDDKLRKHSVTVERNFHGPAHAPVFFGEILQVLSNLILNAVDALPAEGGKLCILVELCDESAHIVIADNGQGIPEEFASRLFEPNVTSKTHGTGLGLWLSKRIITKHAGTLHFESSREEGKRGTSFHISLPTSKRSTQAA